MSQKTTFLSIIVCLFISGTAICQQFSYKPINPAFGGDTFNYNWLLSSATSQNKIQPAGALADEQSELDRFGQNLNNQILAQIARSLTQAQIESIGDLTEPGTFTFGDLAVEVFENGEGLVINILDTTTGEETQVIVPN